MRLRWIGGGLVGLVSLGCVAADYPGRPSPRELIRDLMLPEEPTATRMQRGDDKPILLAQAPTPAATSALPPITLPAPPPVPGLIPPPPSIGGMQQASMKSVRTQRANVRAWVNGRPIFDDEVLLSLELGGGFRDPTADKITAAYNQVLTSIVEMEVAYQDAVNKLQKGNPRALEKLKEAVDQEFEKQARQIRKAVPEDKFRELAPTLRRQLERQFIGTEYLRSRIFTHVNSISHQDVAEEYNSHKNEYMKAASVEWSHVFIGVGAQRPTQAAARQFAEQLLEQVRRGKPLATLVEHDDGDSKTRKGQGFGNRAGEIKPAELEQYLFKMTKDQAGLLELSTGVHLFQLVKRDEGGLQPLNEALQAQIRNKLRNQIFDREMKRVIRDLKSRAVIEIEKGI